MGHRTWDNSYQAARRAEGEGSLAPFLAMLSLRVASISWSGWGCFPHLLWSIIGQLSLPCALAELWSFAAWRSSFFFLRRHPPGQVDLIVKSAELTKNGLLRPHWNYWCVACPTHKVWGCRLFLVCANHLGLCISNINLAIWSSGAIGW